MTPEPRTSLTSRADALSASIESYGSAAATRRTPGATSMARPASSAGFGSPAPPPALSRRLVSRSSSWSAATRSSTASTFWAPSPAAARSSAPNRSRTRASAAAPVTASIRRMPEPMLRSPVMRKPPIWPLARQCVPPHSSKL